MARYLTPAKIGLLVLTEMYVQEAVPSEAAVPVLSFIASHAMGYDANGPSAGRWTKAERVASLVVSIADFETLLSGYPLVMGLPGQRLWDRFVEKLWEICSLHALGDFFEHVSWMLARTKDELRRDGLDPDEPDPGVKLTLHSPLGALVRRARFEYQRLRFDHTAELWKAFVRYRQPTWHQRENPDLGRYAFDQGAHLAVAYGDLETDRVPVSSRDVENLLDFQIDQMQKYGNRIPLEIRRQFHELLNDSFLVPSLTHYMSFLDAWRAGDYPTAFDFLHRYFDYTMQHRDRLFYQYALMNLAVLQADFGGHREAMTAMLETVATARENRDMTCLNFALNWLFHFGQAHADLVRDLQADKLLGTSKETLAFLRVKARETGMWTLWSSVLLSEAKLCLVHGDSIATALEYAVRSAQIMVEKNMKGMFAAQLGLYASLWNRLGLGHLATAACQVFLRCHASHSMFDDELKMLSRLAFALSDQGRYDEALDLMDGADANSRRSWKPNQYWHKYRGIMQLRRDLHHGHLDGAQLLLGQFLQTTGDDFEPDLALVIDTAHVDYLSRRGDLVSAAAKLHHMTGLRDENRDVSLRVRTLLLKASLLDRCGRPQRAFSTALRAANLALRARLMVQLWSAMGAISNILVSMGEFHAAAQLLTAVLPRALECESPPLAARLYSYLADANMGLAADSERRQEHLTHAAAAVLRARNEYAAIEDLRGQRETTAKRAVVARLLRDEVLAADCAAAYAKLGLQTVEGQLQDARPVEGSGCRKGGGG